MKRKIILLMGLTGLLLLASFTSTNLRDVKVKRIVIDAGHGGKDPGTHGLVSNEKDVALKIALEVGNTLQKYLDDVEIIYTRNNDTFLELHERAEVANKNGADLFVSIHCNAWPKDISVNGTETYVMGLHTSERNMAVAQRENEVVLMEDNYEKKYDGFDPASPESYILFSMYQDAYLNHSLTLAQNVEYQFSNRVGRRSRGVKQAGFVVLWRTSMPSILIETGYLTNKNEEQYLNDELGMTYIAHGIFRAIRDYKTDMESQN